MGNLSEGGYLNIELDSETVSVGSELTGSVQCQLKTPCSSGSLLIELVGTEQCNWKEGLTNKRQRWYSAHSEIAKLPFPICTMEGEEYEPGCHTFPFALAIPTNFTASFRFKQPFTEANICYYVVASLHHEDQQVQSEFVPIFIDNRPAGIKSIKDNLTATMLSWGCFSQGQAEINVFIDKNAYRPGENIKIRMEIDNSKSQLDVASVTATLSRRIRLRSREGHSNVSSQTIHACTNSRRIHAGETASSMLLEIPVKLTYPGLTQAPTVKAKYVECVYFLSVCADMAGSCMCFGQQPEIVKEVIIYTGEPKEVLPTQKLRKKVDSEPSTSIIN